ncbi:hypothetical protein [Streptomyces sp. NPDC002671]
MASEEPLCPVCGQPVGTVVGRHKTLGAWVPVWGSGPCRNPDCRAYAERPEAVASAPERQADRQAGESTAKHS